MQRRYRHLFRFYDVQGDGLLSMASDCRPVAEAIAARWQGRKVQFPNLLQMLIDIDQHEIDRRDSNSNGEVDEQEFVDSYGSVLAAFASRAEQSEAFIARAAGGVVDDLGLDRDGVLELADLEAYASAAA
jgi:hypothetical protein